MATVNDDVKLSEQEQQLVQQFVYELSLENAFGDGVSVTEREAVKFLMARKFDVGRAISLFHTHQMMRGKFELLNFDPNVAPLSCELELGKFTVLRGKGKDGVTICIFYGRKHDPKFVDHVTVLRAVVFQLDFVMRCVDVQRNGLALVYDMTNSSYSNFDFDLAMKVLHLLKGGYPARLKAVYILCAPLWFRTSMAVLSTFLRDKIRDRVELIKSHEELQNHIPRDILPEEIGGLSKDSHTEWILKCINSEKTNDDNHGLSTNLPDVANDLSIPTYLEPPVTTRKHEPDKSNTRQQNGHRNEGPPSPDVSPPPIKTQRTDKPPEKPLPPPPSEMPTNKSNAENISSILNDTMNEMEKFLQHNNENIESKGGDRGEETSNVDLFVAKMRKGGRHTIQKEYEHIKGMAPTGEFVSTMYPVNVKKNRYNNILAFEETRVKLDQIDNDIFSDYINASYVDGYNTEKKYICTQGPLPSTLFDFWRMVWEKNVVVIVMITRCVERGRTKCHEYWPNEGSLTLRHLKLTNIACEVQDDFTYTLFEFYNAETQITRKVCHIQFTSWPDFGVLASARPIIEVDELIRGFQEEGIKQIRAELKATGPAAGDRKASADTNEMELSGEYEDFTTPEQPNRTSSTAGDGSAGSGDGEDDEISNSSSTSSITDDNVVVDYPPIVIHCSAGVGRTGTFCCISNSIESYHANGPIDIHKTVTQIRGQRAFSVQTVDQYTFCYTGILEYIIKDRREKGLNTSQLESFLYNFLRSSNSNH